MIDDCCRVAWTQERSSQCSSVLQYHHGIGTIRGVVELTYLPRHRSRRGWINRPHFSEFISPVAAITQQRLCGLAEMFMMVEDIMHHPGETIALLKFL